MSNMSEEQKRLDEDREGRRGWRKWGPYVSDRQWGTVREDYSEDGEAWNYFPFDQAAARAYRWGEDGIFGISDDRQRVCFAWSFWNGKDPILKERFFGLTNGEGNHGEDVKEIYYYLDNTPTHSYMKALYKYPQAAYPYEALRNHGRGRGDPELELIDTGVFDRDEYFDLYAEYAKGSPDDFCIRLKVFNRSEKKAELHALPTLWLRNTWSWKKGETPGTIELKQGHLLLTYPGGESRYLYYEGGASPLFTENESNLEKLFGSPNKGPYVKDAFHEAVIRGRKEAVNPAQRGTKAALHYTLQVSPKGEAAIRLRFSDRELKNPFEDFDAIFEGRKKEADAFYDEFALKTISEERRTIQRQALAGLLWSKQYYNYVMEEWLAGDDPEAPPPESRKQLRNIHWKHLYCEDILSMPDKWEYPWFASWDLGFHAIAFSLIDPEFAKSQLLLLTHEWYMHPNGQVPAYEWNFGDVNPPVLAGAAWRVYKIAQRKHGQEDRVFLEQIFQKLLINFTWWLNRKDSEGRNVFEGGFLGLDNISVFNRSEQLPHGSRLTQSDATSWMASFCINMWAIAIELAEKESNYEYMVCKFYEHFLYIADAINYEQPGSPPLWHEEDGFYYDLLERADGTSQPLRVRSLVGLVPLFAVTTFEQDIFDKLPLFKKRFDWVLKRRENLCQKVACMETQGENGRHLIALLNPERLRRILEKALDEKEFLSPFGIRSLSRIHENEPFTLRCDGASRQVQYEPGETSSLIYGGNSNWRGPVWIPPNFILIESLQKFHHYYGDSFKVECPTGSGQMMNLREVADEISRRLIRLFERDEDGNRPFYGGAEKFQKDPFFRDHLLFYEYFHAEDGSGLGASHQTGWTALIAKLIQQSV